MSQMSDDEKEARLQMAVRSCTARHERKENPDGRFDEKGRWYPARHERCTCCRPIRKPSPKYGLTLNRHCRTAKHVSSLIGVDRLDLLRRIRAARGGGSGGRPKAPMPRPHIVSVRLTDQEKSQLVAKAEGRGATLGRCIRDLITGALQMPIWQPAAYRM